MTAEEEQARVYREQAKKRKEFQEFLAQKRKGDDYARRLLCEKTKPLLQGERGETSND